MLSLNNDDYKGMIKVKKRNYLHEKEEALYMNNEIKAGGFINNKVDEIWRGKSKQLFTKSNQEEKYMINDILKKYQFSQDERKGYDYKYVLELSNLLGQKDKNFSKKRLELYNNRINNKRKTYINYTENNMLKKYESPNNITKITKFKTKFNNKNKLKEFMVNNYENCKNNKYRTYNNFYNKGNKKNFLNKVNFNNNQLDIYSKISNNCNSPKKIASLKYLLTNPKSKSCKKENLLNNNKNDKNIISSLYLTQYNSNEEDSFDTTSLVGKEEFLFYGDREKYHEYLQKEFKFYDKPKLREIKYLVDKQKRIRLFKRLSNDKFLNYRREDPLKIEIFNKINREKNHIFLGKQKDIIKKDNKRKLAIINNKINEKLKFYKNCKNIFENIKKNLSFK